MTLNALLDFMHSIDTSTLVILVIAIPVYGILLWLNFPTKAYRNQLKERKKQVDK